MVGVHIHILYYGGWQVAKIRRTEVNLRYEHSERACKRCNTIPHGSDHLIGTTLIVVLVSPFA